MVALKPKVRTELEDVELDGEIVVYDPRSRVVRHLNHSAAVIYDFFDGERTMREIAVEIAEAYGMPPDEIEKQVRGVHRGLRKLGLLEPTAPTGDSDGVGAVEVEADNDERDRIRVEVPRTS